jgi:hypothetical protein
MMQYVRQRAGGKALQIGVFAGCDHPQQKLHRQRAVKGADVVCYLLSAVIASLDSH